MRVVRDLALGALRPNRSPWRRRAAAVLVPLAALTAVSGQVASRAILPILIPPPYHVAPHPTYFARLGNATGKCAEVNTTFLILTLNTCRQPGDPLYGYQVFSVEYNATFGANAYRSTPISRCITATSADSQTVVTVAPCVDNNTTQLWGEILLPVVGYANLVQVSSGAYLDTQGGHYTNGTPLVIDKPTGSYTQWWFDLH